MFVGSISGHGINGCVDGCGAAGRQRRRLHLAVRFIRTSPPQPDHQGEQRDRHETDGAQHERSRSISQESKRHVPDTIRRREQAGGLRPLNRRRKLPHSGRCIMRLRCACPFRECRKLLKKSNTLFGKGCRLGRKNFENSVDPAPPLNRQNGNRAQTKAPADFRVDERIILGICSMLNLPGAQALPRDSSLGIQPRTQSGSRVATACAADHGAILPHRQRGSGGARQLSGGICDGREHRVQAVVPGCDQLLQGRQSCALIQVTGGVADPAGRSLLQRIAINTISIEHLPGAKRLGLRHDHGSLFISTLSLCCRTNPAKHKRRGRFGGIMSHLRPPVKEKGAACVLLCTSPIFDRDLLIGSSDAARNMIRSLDHPMPSHQTNQQSSRGPMLP